MSPTLLPWILFNAFILLMLALDLFVFHRKAHPVTWKEALGWSLFWIALALLFNLYIYYTQGATSGLNFLTGYLIEKSLSIDNLFVFLLIFKYFQTPTSSLHKVLFWGVLGAILLRALFIWLGITLITHFSWIVYLFGAFLMVSGIKLAVEKETKLEPEKNLLLKLASRLFPLSKEYENDRFFVLKQGKRYATPLLFVLLSIETSDLIFAVDSIPAILAITYDPFIVYTSNIFAILGLRSLFFVLQRMLGLFHYLHYGLSLILLFIGFKMLVSNYLEIPTLLALGVVFLILLISVTLSLLFPRKN